MLSRIAQSLFVGCIATATLVAATDPFIGTWKFNPEKSKMTGEVSKIEALPDNEYKFTFGTESFTIKADGADHPSHFGRTMSIQVVDANHWKTTTKQDGKVLFTAEWDLAADGKALDVTANGTRANGESFTDRVTRKRIAGSTGFAGTWQDTSLKIGAPGMFEIQAYEGDGQTITVPADKVTINMKFDGKEYPVTGPQVPPDSTTSGRRINARTLEITDKTNGKVTDTARITVSVDGKTTTQVETDAGQKTSQTYIYDKQ